MRIYLNVKFEEKGAVKKLALIRWDATNKKWYFEGESLPTCLEPYRLQAAEDSKLPKLPKSQGDGLYYYLITYSNQNWWSVYLGPFSSKEELKSALLKDISMASTDLWGAYSQIYAAAATHRVGVHRSLRREWIRASNSVVESTDSDIQAAVRKKNLECPPMEID